jgi:hypothetical protein
MPNVEIVGQGAPGFNANNPTYEIRYRWQADANGLPGNGQAVVRLNRPIEWPLDDQRALALGLDLVRQANPQFKGIVVYEVRAVAA